jgi:hypothetical protein
MAEQKVIFEISQEQKALPVLLATERAFSMRNFRLDLAPECQKHGDHDQGYLTDDLYQNIQ